MSNPPLATEPALLTLVIVVAIQEKSLSEFLSRRPFGCEYPFRDQIGEP